MNDSAKHILSLEHREDGVAVLWMDDPGGPVNTRLVGNSFTDAQKQKLIQPDIMVPPLLWLVSDATDAITGRRFVAAFWDRALPAAEAAEKCGAPMAWQQLGRQAIFPDGAAR